MTFLTALVTLLSHWRRRPGQMLALAVGLMAATALWSGVQALNAEARDSYARAASAFSGGGLEMLRAADGGALPDAAFGALRRGGWPVSPMIEGRIDAGTRSLRIIGIDPISLPREAGLTALTPEASAAPGDPAAFLRAPWLMLIAPETAAELGLAEGDALDLPSGTSPNAVISADAAPGILVMDVGAAQALLERPGRIDGLAIAPGADLAALPDPSALIGVPVLRRAAPPATDLASLTQSFHLNLTAFGLLSFLVGLFIVHAAIGLAFEQRLPLMRTLRACGTPSATLAGALAVELLGIALVAGLAGLAAGYGIAAALLPDVAATLRGLYGAEAPGALSLSLGWWAAGLGMTLAGAAIASGASIWRAARLPALAIAQPEAWRAAQARALGRQRIAALTVAVLALAAWAALPGLLSGFALMAGVMLCSALTLPSLLALALDFGARRAAGPVASWAWADARQQISGLSLALMALLLALGTNVGVGSMVQGFRDVFHTWLDGRLAAEIYVAIEEPSGAARLTAWLAARGDVLAVQPSWQTGANLTGLPIEVLGLTTDPLMRASFSMLDAAPGAWDAVADGTGVLISEQLSRRLGLAPGDSLTLPAPTGDWPLTVAGVYADYGNPKGQMRLALGALDPRWPGMDRSRFGLRTAPGAAPALIAELKALLGPQAIVVDQAAVKAESRRVFERTFTVTAALNTLTLGVAGAALLTALLTLGGARLAQTAPLWAMGLPRRRIALIELARTAALALLTAAFAVPLGVALTWVLVAVVNPEAFGWRLPLRLYPGDWLQLMALAGVLAAVAAAPSAWRLAHTPPARLLATFAGER
jgi:putative ABC transport system permease protein